MTVTITTNRTSISFVLSIILQFYSIRYLKDKDKSFFFKTKDFLIIRKLPQQYKSEQVSKIIIEAQKSYKKNVMTITTDNGPEFA